jgi:hypothetical protein
MIERTKKDSNKNYAFLLVFIVFRSGCKFCAGAKIKGAQANITAVGRYYPVDVHGYAKFAFKFAFSTSLTLL